MHVVHVVNTRFSQNQFFFSFCQNQFIFSFSIFNKLPPNSRGRCRGPVAPGSCRGPAPNLRPSSLLYSLHTELAEIIYAGRQYFKKFTFFLRFKSLVVVFPFKENIVSVFWYWVILLRHCIYLSSGERSPLRAGGAPYNFTVHSCKSWHIPTWKLGNRFYLFQTGPGWDNKKIIVARKPGVCWNNCLNNADNCNWSCCSILNYSIIVQNAAASVQSLASVDIDWLKILTIFHCVRRSGPATKWTKVQTLRRTFCSLKWVPRWLFWSADVNLISLFRMRLSVISWKKINPEMKRKFMMILIGFRYLKKDFQSWPRLPRTFLRIKTVNPSRQGSETLSVLWTSKISVICTSTALPHGVWTSRASSLSMYLLSPPHTDPQCSLRHTALL